MMIGAYTRRSCTNFWHFKYKEIKFNEKNDAHSDHGKHEKHD